MNDFLKGISNWGSHRPLLWLAIQNTKGDILELGAGASSTPFITDYCMEKHRLFWSYDNNLDFIKYGKNTVWTRINYTDDWDKLELQEYGFSVILIDHAPAERRHIDAIRLKDNCEIMVIHDAEHEGLPYDVYEISKITGHFKYRLGHAIPGMPAKTLLLSNTIDVSKFTIPKFTTI